MRAIVVLLGMVTSAQGAPLAWQPPRDLAQGGGERGPWRQNDSRFDHVDDPSITFDAEGATIVAWVDHRPKDVFVQVRGAPPVNVSRSPAEFSWLPRLAVSPAHPRDVYVLWQEIIFSGGPHGGDILFARSRDGGRTFAQPQNLSRSIHGDGKGRIDRETWQNGSLDLGVTPAGVVVTAWTDYEGHLWLTRSEDRGETFAAPRALVEDRTRPARAPALATTRGAIHLAWSTGEDRSADIRLATSYDDGRTFTAPRIVARTPRFSDAPKLAVDRRGVLHVVFADGDDIFYTRSRSGGRSFAPPRVLSRPHPTGSERGSFPSLAIDGDAVHIIWELYPDRDQPPRGLAHVASRDGGVAFSVPREVPGTADPSGGGNGSFQGRLMRKLAVHEGEVAIVNSSLDPGRGSRVWLVRGRPSG